MKHFTLVIAWDAGQRGPLAVRLAGNLRHAREIGKELWEEYPDAMRISFLKEVDYAFLPARGSDEHGQPAPPFLPPDGEWDLANL